MGIKSGDYVGFLVGEFGAHAVENPSDNMLQCLFFSTMCKLEITVYPNKENFYSEAVDTIFPFHPDLPETGEK